MLLDKKKFIPGLIGVLGFVSLVAFGDFAYAKSHQKGNTSNAEAKASASDKDKDGLSDKEERKLKTNPRDADTDHDGLSDGMEVNKLNTDPKVADSDDDGVKDGDETADGTDPEDSDSDDDGVDDGDDDDDHSADADNYEAPLVPSSDAFTIQKGAVEIDGKNSGKVKLEILELRDAAGNLVTNTGNSLSIDVNLDGVQSTLSIPFDSNEGKVEMESNLTGQILGTTTGQILGITKVVLLDNGGNSFMTPGIKLGGADDDDEEDDNDED